MANVNSLLSQRFKKKEQSTKMNAMATKTSNGNLTGFAGIFAVSELNEREKDYLEAILRDFATDEHDIDTDLVSLSSITAEVKAINNQAAILHGERIKKAHDILTNYRDGAFTTWLVATYGNRQTPYNFMQYFEFYQAMPSPLRPRIEAMPKQAVYTLASRQGPFEKKKQIVENYQGETKNELLETIRENFPLRIEDKRREKAANRTIHILERLCASLRKGQTNFTKTQQRSTLQLIDTLRELVNS